MWLIDKILYFMFPDLDTFKKGDYPKIGFILNLLILVVWVSTAGGLSMLTSSVYPVLYRSNPFGSTKQYFVCRT